MVELIFVVKNLTYTFYHKISLNQKHVSMSMLKIITDICDYIEFIYILLNDLN